MPGYDCSFERDELVRSIVFGPEFDTVTGKSSDAHLCGDGKSGAAEFRTNGGLLFLLAFGLDLQKNLIPCQQALSLLLSQRRTHTFKGVGDVAGGKVWLLM